MLPMRSADRAARHGSSAPTPRLEVYISAHCFGCAEALRLAEAAARQFPGLAVRVIDLEREPNARPNGLVAVPTYLLDGQVVALGNPRQQDLFQRLRDLRAASQKDEGSHGPA